MKRSVLHFPYIELLAALLAGPVTAQLFSPPVSPIVQPDRTVSLALMAPAADSVKAMIYLGDTLDMVQGEDGFWRVDVGPLAPGVYYYSFEVDGMATNDPANAYQHPSVNSNVHSIVIVPAKEPAFYEEQDVPRGTLHHHRHRSALMGDDRGYLVYTPPGYDADGRRYPVLYLLHGYGGSEASWSVSGRAGVILDNLITAGEAEPMILVMPRGYAAATQRAAGDTSWGQWAARTTAGVSAYVTDELIPIIDGSYRTRADADQRALAGLSMGGGQALHIGLRHPQHFAWLGAFSSAVHPAYFDQLLDPDVVRPPSRLFWIGCGRDDFLFEANVEFTKELESRQFDHVVQFTDGGHGWAVWQEYLREFSGRLFR